MRPPEFFHFRIFSFFCCETEKFGVVHSLNWRNQLSRHQEPELDQRWWGSGTASRGRLRRTATAQTSHQHTHPEHASCAFPLLCQSYHSCSPPITNPIRERTTLFHQYTSQKLKLCESTATATTTISSPNFTIRK